MPDKPSDQNHPEPVPRAPVPSVAVALEDVAHAVEAAINQIEKRERARKAQDKERTEQKERLTNRVSIAAICITMLMSFLNFARAEREGAASAERTLAAKAKSDADANWAYYQTRRAERSGFVLADNSLRRETLDLPDSDVRVRMGGAHHAEYQMRVAAIDRANQDLFFVIEDLERQRVLHLRVAGEIEQKVARYDMGTRVLTLAVVLLSVTLLANRRYLFWVGASVALFGAAIAVNGYFLLV